MRLLAGRLPYLCTAVIVAAGDQSDGRSVGRSVAVVVPRVTGVKIEICVLCIHKTRSVEQWWSVQELQSGRSLA